jgi:hypothetical protein
MQAALRAALNEVSHGISLGLVLAAGSRCPDCSPSLVCPELHCPDLACPAVNAPPACPAAFGLSDLIATGVCCAVGGALLVLGLSRSGRTAACPPDASVGRAVVGRPRRGVWGDGQGQSYLSDAAPVRSTSSTSQHP